MYGYGNIASAAGVQIVLVLRTYALGNVRELCMRMVDAASWTSDQRALNLDVVWRYNTALCSS